MLLLNSKNLLQESIDYLKERQDKIDPLPTIEDKAKEATRLWGGKSQSKFKKIKKVLKEMCVGVEICVYCENNEATDVEHIYPKKLYPEKAFTWENYVLACNKCNSHHKSDKFKIFNPKNSATVEDVTRPRGTYKEPDSDDALFINQRKEDPLDLIELDLLNQTFIFIEKYQQGTREYEKASFTIDLLKLNTRGSLVAARKQAVRFYINRLDTYVSAKKATNFQELKDAVDDDEVGSIDDTANFGDEQKRMLDSIKKNILEGSHPTVWKELLRQRASLPKTNRLLNDAPEVVNW